jgi:hypothetical protein
MVLSTFQPCISHVIIGITTPMGAGSLRVVVQSQSSCHVRPIVIGQGRLKVSQSRKCGYLFGSVPAFKLNFLYSVIATSAHAAFDKAGHYFNIKIVHVPVDPVTRQVNISRVKRAMYVDILSLFLYLTQLFY